MTFLNPLALLGLAAASIPILLHFFNLRKLQTVEFSTLSFLKELQKTKIRKLKVTQLLLLLLRILLVICAVLAFARPAVKTSFAGLGAKAKSSVVIVLDNSFSMELADEHGVRLKQAKDAVLSVLQTLGDGDEVALVQMANLDDKRFFEFTRDFGLLREEVRKIPVSYTSARLETALRMASGIILQSKNLNREIFVITDAQKNILAEERLDSLKLFDPNTALFLVPVGLQSKASERNLSVDSLVVETKIFERGKPVELQARIRNSSSEAAQGVIVSVMMNGERVAQRTVDVPAAGTRTVSVAAVAPLGSGGNTGSAGSAGSAGFVRGSVEVEGDVLDADNRRHFGFVLPDRPRVGVVATPQDGEFLRLALASASSGNGGRNVADGNAGGVGNSSAPVVTMLPPTALSAANLNEFDALFVVNVPRFSTSDVSRLRSFLERGGTATIFAGSDSDVASYNATILQEFQLGTAVAHEYPSDRPAEFSAVDKAHPLFVGVFKGAGSEANFGANSGAASGTGLNASNEEASGNAAAASVVGVESPKLLRSLTLQRETSSAQAIIELPDGVFLAESRAESRAGNRPENTAASGANSGGGRLYYCAVPPTTAFGNFAVTGIFVTLANRITTLATAAPFNGVSVGVGEPVVIPLASAGASPQSSSQSSLSSSASRIKSGSGVFTIIDPNNVASVRQAVVLPSGASLRLEELRQPGVYAVGTGDAAAQARPQTFEQTFVQTIAVNPPSSESAMSMFSPAELLAQLADRVANPERMSVVESPQRLNPERIQALRAGAGTELWRLFLLVALLCAVAEMLVWRRAAAQSQEA
jgi:hypothetical protein